MIGWRGYHGDLFVLIFLVPGIALLLILGMELAFKHLRDPLGTHKSSRLARCWALGTFMAFLMIVLYSYSLILGLAAIVLSLILGMTKIPALAKNSPGI